MDKKNTFLEQVTLDHQYYSIKQVKKRTKNPDRWVRTLNKIKRLKGLEYQTRSERRIPAKVFQNVDCGCKNSCMEKIDIECRKRVRDDFYNLSSHIEQNIFLRGCCQVSKIKRHRPKDNSKLAKARSFKYYIRINNENVNVCKKYFLDTFQISCGRLYECAKKEFVSDIRDKRGKHVPGNKIDDSMVVQHINSFPVFNNPQNPNVKYLSADLNVSKMYDLYQQYCFTNNLNPVKKKYYYRVFSTKFNLNFQPTSKVSK